MDTDDFEAVERAFEYEAVYWKKGRFAKERRTYQKSLIQDSNKKTGEYFFYTGNIRRILSYCHKHKIKTQVIKRWSAPEPETKPNLKGITFRADQLEILNKALRRKWGVILSPTGSGKTILQLGLMSAFPKGRILLLAHTKDIVRQTYDEMNKFGMKNLQMIHGGRSKKLSGDIIVSTIQSFYTIPYNQYMTYFEMVIIDEGHHIAKFGSMYGEVLTTCLAPLRYAFTATLPTTEISKLVLEALIGPVISHLKINTAVDKKILAKPTVKIKKIPYENSIRAEKAYGVTYGVDPKTEKKVRTGWGVYQTGIVRNDVRNRTVISIAINLMKEDKSSLIMVTKIEHGNRLVKLAKEHYNIKVPFVNGDMSSKQREKIKGLLNKKEVKIVACTVVWREGINIPTLDAVINAAGGKDEKATLQAVGRGLRRTKNKKTVTIYDFFDPSHPYLIGHFGERLTLYMDEGWL
jgi:superfamily II DNA or RNA helicase